VSGVGPRLALAGASPGPTSDAEEEIQKGTTAVETADQGAQKPDTSPVPSGAGQAADANAAGALPRLTRRLRGSLIESSLSLA